MAAPVTGASWRMTEPGAIEADLTALWLDVEQSGPIARAVMSNLLVLRMLGTDTTENDAIIDAVAAQHPCRVLVIDHGRTGADPRDTLAAKVRIATFGPPRARYGVEQIAVRSTAGEASLPSIIRRLTRGGLPISVWWADDFSDAPLIGSIVDMARQLVYDSRRWRDVRRGVLALEPWLGVDLVDVNWRRLSSMRRALAFAATSAATNGWDPEGVRIVYAPGEEALAWLLAGWLASRLGWPRTSWPTVEEKPHPRILLAIAIRCGSEDLVASYEAAQVIVTHGTGVPSIVAVPRESVADGVAAELHALWPDTGLHETIDALIARFRDR